MWSILDVVWPDAKLMKHTYAELILIIKELRSVVTIIGDAPARNLKQAARIMELEFDLRRFSRIMVNDHQENAVREYGVAESNVASLEEFRKAHPKPKGGGGNPPEGDWLSTMVWGTEFLVRPKMQKTWLLAKFMMAGVRHRMVLVIPMRGDEPVQDDKDWMWVDPVEWCKYWELMAVLMVPKDNNE